MKIDLSGRTALVTGGSRGLGLAMCERFAASGAKVIAIARDPAVLEAAVADVAAKTGGEIAGYVCDMAQERQIRDVFARIEAAHGGVDILVNNAGASATSPFADLDPAALREDFEGKVVGAAVLAQLVLPHMKGQRWGRIINVLSIVAKAAPAGSAPTSLSRAAGLSMTNLMAKDLAPHNILVNALCAGKIESGQWQRRYEAAGRPGTYEAFLNETGGQVPMGRMGRAEEFAAVACFLASDAASYLSGTSINIDGGLSPIV